MASSDPVTPHDPLAAPSIVAYTVPDSGSSKLPASRPMPRPTQIAVGSYVVVTFLAVVYFLIKFWPIEGSTNVIQFFFTKADLTIAPEIRLMLIAALAGALGAYVHLATSFADYAGNEELTSSWTWWYLLRPLVGVSLAEIVYLCLRGGLVTGAGAGSVSPYGVAATCSLTGLFSRQATDKLRETFETLFRTQQAVQRKDALPRAAATQPAGAAAADAVKTKAASASTEG